MVIEDNLFTGQQPQSSYVPTDWQLEDLAKLLELDHSANWSEMGCYKTSTLLWLMQEKLSVIKNPRMLVITTRTGKGTYFQLGPSIHPDWTILNVNADGMEWAFDGKLFKWEGDELPDRTNGPLLVVTHYHSFTNKSRVLPLFKNTAWDMLALDEAHRIKDRNSQWTRNIKRIKSVYRHAMTGTGFINRPSELWSILNFLYPKVFTSFHRYFDEYCEVDEWGQFKKELGVKPEKKEELRELTRTLGPRRTKVEVFKNLKEPIFTTVDIDLNATQRKMYEGIKQDLFALDRQGFPIHSPNVLSQLNRLRQISVATPEVIGDRYDPIQERRVQVIRLVEPSSKLDAVMDILEGLEWDEDRRDQVVVFSNFKDPIELLKVRLEKKQIGYIHMEQKDSDKARYDKWAIEFPKKNHQVFISTLQLGSESISLTSAQTLVFLDRSWSPKDNEQGISRVWRPGQKLVPQIINIEARNTVDRKIFNMNQQKLGWFRDIFAEDEDGSL